MSIQCKKDSNQVINPTPQFSQQQSETEEEQMILGQQLNNPYTVANMQQALLELQSENFPGANSITVTATHRYIKFSPQNDEELNLLLADTVIVYYDYPLDYEIESDGMTYYDPTLSGDVPTFQYASIPIDHIYPSTFTHTVLADLFLPDELFYSDIYGNPLGMSEELVDALVAKAFFIANVDDDDDESNKTTSNDPPSGTIRVYDDIFHQAFSSTNGTIPLEGVKVLANRWFTTHTGLTNAIGEFTCNGKFKKPWKYKIKWERKLFSLRFGIFGQAYYSGPSKTKNNWHLQIFRSGTPKSLGIATIHRAAMQQFYGDNLGITRPTLALNANTKIWYAHTDGTGVAYDTWSVFGALPDIKIWGISKTTLTLKPTNIIFATTAHELGHQAHIRLIGLPAYLQVSENIYESWAECVEWAMTNAEYASLGITMNHLNGRQWWEKGNVDYDQAYTPVFIDLIDDFNQRSSGVNFPNDNVTGYTFQTLNNTILPNTLDLGSLGIILMANKPTGVTNSDIYSLITSF